MIVNKGFSPPSIAVLVPCLDEAITIEKVIKDVKLALPKCEIYVYDNDSSDGTYDIALEHGAHAKRVKCRGKSFVVSRMFADIDADIYIMIDGDDTYDLEKITEMVELVNEQSYDMVVGRRNHTASGAYRPGHVFGNWFLTKTVQILFGQNLKDMLSGLRVFKRGLVKSFPVQSEGFGLETELNIHALTLGLAVCEVDIKYKERPEDSFSKLNTIYDGIKIMRTITRLVFLERSFFVYSSIAILLSLAGIYIISPIVFEFLETGKVPRLPTAIAASFLFLTAVVSMFTGAVLDGVARVRKEAKLLFYILNS